MNDSNSQLFKIIVLLKSFRSERTLILEILQDRID